MKTENSKTKLKNTLSVDKKVATNTLTEAVVDGVQNTNLAEKRRDQICDAALELFLDKGFASTTIRDICAKSGVNQASIYDYIANKNDILRRLLNKMWFRPDVLTLNQRLGNYGHLSLHENIANYFRDTWSIKRKGTLLAYRTVSYLEDDDRAALRQREESAAADLVEQLRHITKIPEGDPKLKILAQLIIYLASFAPMRDWLMKDIDNELVLDTVATAVAAMIDKLTAGNTE